MKLARTLPLFLVLIITSSVNGQLHTVDSDHFVVTEGETLSLIANSRYGSRAYAGFIGVKNQVDAKRLQIGRILSTPDFKTALLAADYDAPSADYVATIYDAFRAIELEILESRYQNTDKDVFVPLDRVVLQRLSELSTDVMVDGEDALPLREFSEEDSKQIRNHLVAAQDAIRKVSAISKDTYASDIERVHSRLNALLVALLKLRPLLDTEVAEQGVDPNA